MATVSHALLVTIPDPADEGEFTHTREAMRPVLEEIRDRAAAMRNRRLDMAGRETEEPLLATIRLISETELFYRDRGFQGRRYLTGLLFESIAMSPAAVSADLLLLAAAIRSELKSLRSNRTSRSPIPDGGSLFGFIKWLDEQPQSSTRLPAYFWGAWRRSISATARRAVFYPAVMSEPLESGDEGTYITVEAGEGHDDHPPGWLPQPSEDQFPSFSSGSRLTAVQASLSTLTPATTWTEASSTALSDESIRREVNRLLGVATSALDETDIETAEASVVRLLVVATGTAPSRCHDLVWGVSGDRRPYPGVLSLDSEWLFRSELRPENAIHGDNGSGAGEVWVPLPRQLSQVLRRLHPSPCTGQRVFSRKLVNAGGGRGTPSLAALRRALPARLARTEPMGMTGAQWVTGDTLGLGLVMLHYDRFQSGRLARAVEHVVLPWFGEKPGRARKILPRHVLGSRVDPNRDVVRRFYESLRQLGEASSQSLVGRIAQRTHNLVHGLAAVAGHRPNNAFGRLTLNNFGISHPIAVLEDKRVAPEWRARPVAIPKIWHEELGGLLADLAEAIEEDGDNALGHAAKAALSGAGPIFLDVRSPIDVSPYSLEAFSSRLPLELIGTENFARHLLNVFLIGRVPEAVRVAQCGWHGAREGAYADGAPWSVLDVAAQLEKPLTEHLKAIGWGRLPCRTITSANSLPSEHVDWTAASRTHIREFDAHLRDKKRAMADRHSEMARAMRSKLQEWLDEHVEELTLSPNGKFARAPSDSSDRDTPIKLTKEQLRNLETYLASGNSRSLKGAVARNMLSAMVRQARRAGVVHAPIPRRVVWSFPSRPGAFHRSQPRALRDWEELDQWIYDNSSPAVAAQDGSGAAPLCDQALALVSLIAHGGYPQLELLCAAIGPDAELFRCSDSPHVLLVNIATGDEGRQQCLAFHGLAALHLVRWHRQGKGRTWISMEELVDHVYGRLPSCLKPAAQADTLVNLTQLASARRALHMDGLARMIGSGVVLPAGADARRVAALWDEISPIYDDFRDVPSGLEQSATRGGSARGKSLSELHQLLTKAVSAVQSDHRQEAAERKKLAAALVKWCDGCKSRPTAVDLLARYALALLQSGGRRRASLQLRTVRGYVYDVGSSFARHMPQRPMEATEKHWQDAYLRLIASSAPSVRATRFGSLHMLHWILSQEMDLPRVDFGSLAELAGSSFAAVDVGFFCQSEIDSINQALEEDMKALGQAGASPAELHAGAGRQSIFELMLRSAMRSGEAVGIGTDDLEVTGTRTVARIRSSTFLRLKNFNARRTTELDQGVASNGSPLAAWSNRLCQAAGERYARPRPMWGRLNDPGTPMGREDLLDRIGELARWATGLRNARPYWLRKTAAWRRLRAYTRTEHTSLWPLRTLLAGMGHGSIVVTLHSYIHDPIVAFERWFNNPHERVSSDRLAIAAGKPPWHAVRRGSGGRGAFTTIVTNERVANLLKQVRTVKDGEGSRSRSQPPPISAATSFRPTFDEVDRVLRLVSAGGDIENVAKSHRWPATAIETLTYAIAALGSDFSVAVGASCDVGVTLLAPRRLAKDGGVGAIAAEQAESSVLAEMATAWLHTAAVPGSPAGIASPASVWEDWMSRLPVLAELGWSEARWGGNLVRCPKAATGRTTSPWPVLRWSLVVIWVQRRLNVSRQKSQN